ncbi:MAG TPA: hypothetical protein VJU13_11970 [Candidatus Nitrosocosmicus sp.]|nr:hypothetical protein [Candidatus Nitrosocosmicus sp.]
MISACIYKRQLLIEDINDTLVSKLDENESRISALTLGSAPDRPMNEQLYMLTLSFSIDGFIRQVLTQKNWERAYNKHDNSLRLSIKLDIKNDGKIIESIKLVRKAIFFWTRNPKIDHRIWIMIVKDDTPFYPLEEEEARQLLFDFNKDIEIKPETLKKGKNNITVSVELSWGKHEFIEKNILKKETNIQQIENS